MTTVGSGDYTYTLIENWAKLPPGETWGNTSSVATDSQDRVYVCLLYTSDAADE